MDSAVIVPKLINAAEEKNTLSSCLELKTYQIVGTGYYGCIDKENFKRLRDILMQRDDAAFLREVTASVTKGECVRLNKGEKVYLEGGSTISSIIRIKKEGNPNSYWTTTKALQTQPEK